MRPYTVSLCMTLILAGCGKKGALVYPEMLVPASPSNLAAQQSGNSLKLSFQLPSKDLAGRSVAALSDVSVFKHDAPVTREPGCSTCASDFSLFRKINLDVLTSGTQRYGNYLVLMDDSVTSGRTYTYRVSTTTTENTEGALSQPVSVALVPASLPPVTQIFNQPTEVQLEFVALKPDEGVITGYNVYRTLKGEAYSYIPLNNKPITGNCFVDVGLDRRTTYLYRVRSVVMLQDKSMIESIPSNEVEGKLKDDE